MSNYGESEILRALNSQPPSSEDVLNSMARGIGIERQVPATPYARPEATREERQSVPTHDGTPNGIPVTEPRPLTMEGNRVTLETFPIASNPTVDTARPEPERPNTIYWRQLDIIRMDDLRTLPIVVIGAGSVGSFTVLSLAKMGAENITVYDDDKVEPHNLPNQFFRMKDVGKKKVVALAKIVEDFTGIKINTIAKRYEDQALQGVVLITVDSMASRKLVWNKAKMNPMVKMYVDSRMGAQVYDVQSFRPTDKDAIKYYEDAWYDDKDAMAERCSEKAIIYTVMVMANVLCNMVKKYIQGDAIPIRIAGDCVTLMQNVEDSPLECEEECLEKADVDYEQSERMRMGDIINRVTTQTATNWTTTTNNPFVGYTTAL